MRHLQHIKFDLSPAIKFVIGLFCRGNFEYEQMSKGIKERGVEMKEVEKISISKGFFNVHTSDTKLSIPLKETEAWHSKHCHICDDYSAELADISVGSEGSKEGWSSVIIRTDEGEKVFSELESKGCIRTEEIDNLDYIKGR
ncbi:MAG: Coenzyme F420 hydrogenase/dehydrogenase, beta subunit C-terminal domain [Candidatus Methanospirareceae archaeon]